MKILFAASECVPFAKTGGLADVIGALPKALVAKNNAQQKAEVCVVLPLYKKFAGEYADKLKHQMYFYVNLGWRRQYCGIELLEQDGIKYYFLDNDFYFGRDTIYGSGSEEAERFAFFCRAVLEALPHIDFIPDILHCHDWQTGMIPVLLKTQYNSLDLYKNIKVLYTIHNLQYQGIFAINQIEDLLVLGSWIYTDDKLEFYGGCNFMKGALVYSDAITTVSPNYSSEIQTPYYGERLDGLIRSRSKDLYGIINGIDMDLYNPLTDKNLAYNYDESSFEKKKENKMALQKELGLDVDPDIPMISMITRLSSQKGLDLVEYALAPIMEQNVQFVVLGMGDEKFTNLFRWAAWLYLGKLSARIEMNFPLANRIYAGSDLFLMPSQFEPCGLSQMISMRYGTVPIVRETGGLKDTVTPYNEADDSGTGFTFYSYNADDMLRSLSYAVDIYRNKPEKFAGIAKRGMKGDYSWNVSARDYMAIYENLLK
ncbi:MAG: glycogen synthase GlgA [Christensenellales bacterium]|jgi:starch synthase